jgi:hypothetical protein
MIRIQRVTTNQILLRKKIIIKKSRSMKIFKEDGPRLTFCLKWYQIHSQMLLLKYHIVNICNTQI